MSAPVQTTPAWQWPADVLAFAAEQGVQVALDPLLEATRRLYPTASRLRVYVADDPELRDDRHIVFDVEVPGRDVPDFVQAVHNWNDELGRCCPKYLTTTFRLLLVPLDP
jgi:hypothetical protein